MTPPNAAVPSPTAHFPAGRTARRFGSNANIFKTCLLATALGVVAACTPYNFSKEIGDFSQGITQISGSFDTGTAAWDSDQIALLHLRRVERRTAISLSDDCTPLAIMDNLSRCDLVALKRQGPVPAVQPELTPEDALQRQEREERQRKAVRAEMAGLVSYAHALAAVTNADDRSKFEAASKRLSLSVKNFTTLAAAAAPGIDVVAPAVTNILLWGIGLKLDYDRYDALRQETGNAQAAIDSIAKALGQQIGRIRLSRANTLRATAIILVEPLGPGMAHDVYDRRLTAAEQVVAQIRALGSSHPDELAKNLAATHAAMVAAINDPNRQLEQLITSIEKFKSLVEALQTAMEPKKT